MGSGEVVRQLSSIAELQWGLVTTHQAVDAGVSKLQVSRLASRGVLERVDRGVYRFAGVPASEHEEILAAWLVLDQGAGEPVVAGAAAARLHGIGDLWLDRLDFIVSERRTTRRQDVRIRIRSLSEREIVTVEGVPTLSAARTIADLIEQWVDLSIVADALAEGVKRGSVDPADLTEFLEPLAAGHGFGDGARFCTHMLELAGVESSRR